MAISPFARRSLSFIPIAIAALSSAHGHAEIYLVEQTNSSVTVMAEMMAADLSEKEFVATYGVASFQRAPAGEPALVVRSRFSAVCDRKGKSLGVGQILLQHSMAITREIDGSIVSVLKSVTNETPEPVAKSNALWYSIARKACLELPPQLAKTEK